MEFVSVIGEKEPNPSYVRGDNRVATLITRYEKQHHKTEISNEGKHLGVLLIGFPPKYLRISNNKTL